MFSSISLESKKETKCSDDNFAILLEEIYDSSACLEMPREADLKKLPSFSLHELKNAMKHMRNKEKQKEEKRMKQKNKKIP